MSATTAPTPTRTAWLLAELERPGDALRHLGPNWFASVMGTGIVANAAALLPVHVAGLRAFAIGVWLLAAALLALLVAATAARWILFPAQARAHLRDPAMAPFHGAPPMALLTVGAGTLLVGHDLVGTHAAAIADGVLWTLGTATGLAVAITVPLLLRSRGALRIERIDATWLLPVVPPLVAAASGAALIAHLPAGGPRLALLLACYALLGCSLLASAVVVALLWRHLARSAGAVGPARTVPTLWLVLGPLGQSITALGLLTAAAGAEHVVSAPHAAGLRHVAVALGLPLWGIALGWLAVAARVTVRTAREHLPFSLTWWSFTFPVGTCVTGTSELARLTGSPLFRWAAVALYGLLLLAWATAFSRTLHGALRGRLLAPPR